METNLKPRLFSTEDALRQVDSRLEGLGAADAEKRLALQRSGGKRRGNGREWWRLLFNPFRSPLVVPLLVAVAISAAVGETMDAMIVLSVALVSALQGGKTWADFHRDAPGDSVRGFTYGGALVSVVDHMFGNMARTGKLHD